MRRILTVALPFLVVPIAAGCATFGERDTAARVDDEVLTVDELAELTPAVNPAAEPTSADAARNTINVWLLAQAARIGLAEQGIEVTDADRDRATATLSDPASGLPDFAALDDDLRDELVDLQAILELYSQQPPDARDQLAEAVDIAVAPRYGTFDPDVGVIPLGLPSVATG